MDSRKRPVISGTAGPCLSVGKLLSSILKLQEQILSGNMVHVVMQDLVH